MANAEAHAGSAGFMNHAGRNWRLGVDAGSAVMMLAATLFAITTSRTNAAAAETVWKAMPIIFGVLAFGLSWLHGSEHFNPVKAAIREAASWAGVFLAILVTLHLVTTELMTAASAGLACAVVLSLGTFLSGVHGQWRLAAIGAAMFGGTAVVALVEQNLWLLIGVFLLGIGLVLVVGRVQSMVERP